jgi:hypothetical protein
MKPIFLHRIVTSILAIVLTLSFNVSNNSMPIPLTGARQNQLDVALYPAAIPGFANFVAQVRNGDRGQVTGIYADRIFALPVVQQPDENDSYIAAIPQTVTQFHLASIYGALGFLAHNTLAGSLFYKLAEGSLVTVVYGDGHFDQYAVARIRHFKAVSPQNLYSDFFDLEQGISLSVSDLFSEIYGVSGQVILQTCIANDGADSWGRLFVIATPSKNSLRIDFTKHIPAAVS